jgi:hypothetical protein
MASPKLPSGPGGLTPPPAGQSILPPPAPTGGPTPSYPILTEELGYPPSPLSNGGGGGNGALRSPGSGRSGALGPVVNRALQDVLGWKVKPGDATGFVGALNQSFQLKMFEGAVVSTWTPRSYAVQTDLSGGISGAQASIYTMAKTTLDQILPLIDGLAPLDPASNGEDVAALKDLTISQLTNLTTEIGYLGGPRVMRVQQYFQMLLGANLHLTLTPSIVNRVIAGYPPAGSPLLAAFPTWQAPGDTWPVSRSWTDPDYILGSLGDLRDELGLFAIPVVSSTDPFSVPVPTYINSVSDEQNVTNFRIVVDYANALLSAWSNSIQYFAGPSSPFLGTQLVIISRQLGVISETVDEVRFVLDSVFIGPAQRETLQIVFSPVTTTSGILHLPPIYLEDLLNWMQNFVGAEAQDMIQNGGKLGLGEDFATMMSQLYTQAHGLYLYAQKQPTAAIGTARVQQSLYKLTTQLGDLYNMAVPIGVPYAAPRQ